MRNLKQDDLTLFHAPATFRPMRRVTPDTIAVVDLAVCDRLASVYPLPTPKRITSS